MSGPTFTLASTLILTVGSVSFAARGQCEVQQLLGDIAGVDNDFGRSVAIQGDLAVIGDPFPLSYPTTTGGVAYVFRLLGGTWTNEAVLEVPGTDPVFEFANAVALSDSVIVVGAWCTAAPDFQSGAAHVFRYDSMTSSWAYEAMLTASDGDTGDKFGLSVSIDGDVIAIGAVKDENQAVTSAGSVYVFRFNGSSWIEEAKLVDPEPVEFDALGLSVDVLDNVIVAGSPIGLVTNTNHTVLIFRYDGSTWTLEQELTVPDITDGPVGFGRSVSLADDLVLVGAPGRPGADGLIGPAYLFQFDGCRWTLQARLLPSDPVGVLKYGWSVALASDGNTAIIGAPSDLTLGFLAGAAFIFRRDGQRWNETAKLLASDGNSGDQFGDTVSLSQDVALVGTRKSGVEGSAYLFAGVRGVDCNSNDASDACDIFDEVSQDANANGIPDECEAVGDLNGDGTVGIVDFLMLLAAWGPCGQPCPPSCAGDLNGDCAVDEFDFDELLINWS